MPELPEVEAAVADLRHAIVGRTIARMSVTHPSLRRSLSSSAARRLVGRRVAAVERRGKHQLIVLGDDTMLHAHFRMTGDWVVHASHDRPRHARLTIECDDGTCVSLDDPRALSSVTLVRDRAALPALGPEADALDTDYLLPRLARRKGAIKPVLMDQRLIAGLGNIYAAEALWRARIDPRSPASGLSRPRVRRLVDGIRDALRAGRERPARYSDGDLSGLAVYGREGESCRRCRKRIRRIVQSGRSTYFCPGCQRV